ncbi:MAG: manno-octulosonate cytidylyltransferase [Pseudomonadota bacterium]
MSVLIVIPARYGSTRYPGKALATLRGPDGEAKSLIKRTWEASQKVSGVDRVVVATDDARIEAEAKSFGADVAMTSVDCENGTERCAEALEVIGGDFDIVVNLQGDAPLTPHWFVEDLVLAMRETPSADVATPVLRCDAGALASFREDRKAGRVGGTTAVFRHDKTALYFSKEVIPYADQIPTEEPSPPVYHHVGVYAYRPDALAAYPQMKAGPLEALEGLEQLRFLENGKAILCVEVDGRGQQFWELNNPEDVPRIEAMLAAQITQ